MKQTMLQIFMVITEFSYFVTGNMLENKYVPVLMWNNLDKNDNLLVPTMTNIDETSFKSILTNIIKIKRKALLIIAEENINIEDITLLDVNGTNPFSNISKTYDRRLHFYSRVENAIKVLKNLTNYPIKLSMKNINYNDLNIGTIYFINFNNSKDSKERRKRYAAHADIIQNVLNKTNNDTVVIYTGNKPFWKGNMLRTSSKLDDLRVLDESFSRDKTITGTFINSTNILMYGTDKIIVTFNKKDHIFVECVSNKTKLFRIIEEKLHRNKQHCNETKIVLCSETHLQLTFIFEKRGSYWSLANLKLTDMDSMEYNIRATMYAPLGFSYHCNQASFSNTLKNISLNFPGFQVQPFVAAGATQFGESYDCLGNFSPGILCGMFVAAHLLIILAIGIDFLLDIKTPTKFEDAHKTKPLTIVISEK